MKWQETLSVVKYASEINVLWRRIIKKANFINTGAQTPSR